MRNVDKEHKTEATNADGAASSCKPSVQREIPEEKRKDTKGEQKQTKKERKKQRRRTKKANLAKYFALSHTLPTGRKKQWPPPSMQALAASPGPCPGTW